MVAEGRCKRLVITLPPRSLKSLYASIAFPAWMLGHDPCRCIVCVSYGRNLATAHANSFRSIVRTPWYRALFPLMRIDSRKDTEDEVRTTRGGFAFPNGLHDDQVDALSQLITWTRKKSTYTLEEVG